MKAGLHLLNSTLTASYLILLAGDVCKNPGPVIQDSKFSDFPTIKIKVRGLAIAHLNICSLYGKLDQLKFVINKSFGILTISETWLESSIVDQELYLSGYSCIRRDREGKTGGSVAIYCSDGLTYSVHQDLNNANEFLWIQVNRH